MQNDPFRGLQEELRGGTTQEAPTSRRGRPGHPRKSLQQLPIATSTSFGQSCSRTEYQALVFQLFACFTERQTPPCVTFHMSNVTCHISPAICHMSGVRCQVLKIFFLFIDKVMELVCGGSVINGPTPPRFYVTQSGVTVLRFLPSNTN